VFFAVQKIPEFVVDVDKSLEGLVGEYRVGNRVIHIVEHRLVIDVRRWDGLTVEK
jgi:hypothetical protein